MTAKTKTPTYSLVMRAYPESYRTEHGDELVFTANELSDGWSLRQSRSLLVEGLRTRTRLATNGSPKNAWASGVAFALGLFQLSWLAFMLVIPLGASGVEGLEPRPLIEIALVAVPLVAMTISTKWPSLVVVTGALIVSAVLPSQGDLVLTGGFLRIGIWVALFAWLAFWTDGPRVFSPLLGVSFLGFVVAFGMFVAPVFVAPATLALIPIALLMFPVDPRPSIVVVVLALFFVVAQVAVFWESTPFIDVDLLVVGIGTGLMVIFALLARFSTRRALAVER